MATEAIVGAIGAEILRDGVPETVLGQIAVEVIHQGNPTLELRVSQVAVEILRPNATTSTGYKGLVIIG